LDENKKDGYRECFSAFSNRNTSLISIKTNKPKNKKNIKPALYQLLEHFLTLRVFMNGWMGIFWTIIPYYYNNSLDATGGCDEGKLRYVERQTGCGTQEVLGLGQAFRDAKAVYMRKGRLRTVRLRHAGMRCVMPLI